jgi:hypothetical protein
MSGDVGLILTNYPRIFAPKVPVTFRLPMDADNPNAVCFRARVMLSSEQRESLLLASIMAGARERGLIPRADEIAQEVLRQKELVISHVEAIIVPDAPEITDREEIRALILRMTPTAYGQLESCLIGASELSLVEKPSSPSL